MKGPVCVVVLVLLVHQGLAEPWGKLRATMCDSKITDGCSSKGGFCVEEPFQENCGNGTLRERACTSKYCQCCIPEKAPSCEGKSTNICINKGGSCVLAPFEENCKTGKLIANACMGKDCQCCAPEKAPSCEGKMLNSCANQGGQCVLAPFKENCPEGTLIDRACTGPNCQCCVPEKIPTCEGKMTNSCAKKGGQCVLAPFEENCQGTLIDRACTGPNCQCCVPEKAPSCEGKMLNSCAKQGGQCVLAPFEENCPEGTLIDRACTGPNCQCCVPEKAPSCEGKMLNSCVKQGGHCVLAPFQDNCQGTLIDRACTGPNCQCCVPEKAPSCEGKMLNSCVKKGGQCVVAPFEDNCQGTLIDRACTGPDCQCCVPEAPTAAPTQAAIHPPTPPPTQPPTPAPTQAPTQAATEPPPPPPTQPPPPPPTQPPTPAPTQAPTKAPTQPPPPPPTQPPPPPPTQPPPPPPTQPPPPPPTQPPPPPPTQPPTPAPLLSSTPATPVLPQPTKAPKPVAPCPKGFSLHDRLCLYINDVDTLSWEDARDTCVAKGSRLHMPDDVQEFMNFANDNYNGKQFWLGASDIESEGKWITTHGEALQSGFPWAGFQPDNMFNEDCLMYPHWWAFNDQECSDKLHYICEACPTGYTRVGPQCLSINTEKKLTWQQANDKCHANGDSLAIVKDFAALQQYLGDKYGGAGEIHFWLGGHKSQPQVTWRDDDRCGSAFPLPNGSPSICNPSGPLYCCSNHNWCGKSDAHCKCLFCTDYAGAPLSRYYGPQSRIWSDNECDNIGVHSDLSVSECKDMCDSTSGCTAINFKDDTCVLRECGSTPPMPVWDYSPWVGYSKVTSDWVWVNGADMSGIPWGLNEPNNVKGAEECFSFIPNHGYSDGSCSKKMFSVCSRGI